MIINNKNEKKKTETSASVGLAALLSEINSCALQSLKSCFEFTYTRAFYVIIYKEPFPTLV